MTFNINNVPNNANVFLPPTPVIPGNLIITGISRTKNMIVRFINSVENTYREGQIVVLTIPRPYGMFQANGLQGKILAVLGSNFILDINSTGFDRFVIPTGVTITQPASLSPGGARNLQFSNTTRLVPFQSFIQGVTVANPGVSINQVVFNIAGSYTYEPSEGMTSCMVEVVGAGGGGGGISAGNIEQAGAGGGGAGAYAMGIFSADQIGSSQSVVVGQGGIGGDTSGGNGASGNSSSFGSFISCGGGNGGQGQATSNTGGIVTGGTGGTAAGSGVSFSNTGWQGQNSFWSNTASGIFLQSGAGANSIYGTGGTSFTTGVNFGGNGSPGTQGAGGSGAFSSGDPRNQDGGNGGDGLVIITEFII